METPLTVLMKLRGYARKIGAVHSDHCFLLESVEGGERLARYSIVGVAPSAVLAVGEQGKPYVTHSGDPLIHLEEALSKKIPLAVPSISLPAFTGGAVGFVGYDCVRYFEPRVAPIVDAQEDVLGIPEALFMIVDTMVVFDHVRHTIKVVSQMDIPAEGGPSSEGAYASACEKIDALQNHLAAPLPATTKLLPLISPVSPPRSFQRSGTRCSSPTPPMVSQTPPAASRDWDAFSNVGREGYEAMVHKIKNHIIDGDVIQAVTSHRISRPIPRDSGVSGLDMYRQLRIVNPSPYMFYLECGNDFSVRFHGIAR